MSVVQTLLCISATFLLLSRPVSEEEVSTHLNVLGGPFSLSICEWQRQLGFTSHSTPRSFWFILVGTKKQQSSLLVVDLASYHLVPGLSEMKSAPQVRHLR